jgi:hypothetical protein
VDTLTIFGVQEMPEPVLASQEELRSMAFVLTTLDDCLREGGNNNQAYRYSCIEILKNKDFCSSAQLVMSL